MRVLTAIDHWLCSPEASLKEAMKRITDAGGELLVQIVVDDGRRFLGLITDGDIRRGLLQGHTLDSPARTVMNTNAVRGQLGDSTGNLTKLQKLNPHRAFLPLLGPGDVVTAIAILADAGASGVSALIMAGGFGSRLGDLTQSMPKPLLPVGDLPILEHILRRLEAASVADIYLSVHYLAEQIQDFVQRRQCAIRISVLHEVAPMGTAGALQYLNDDVSRPLLVINGDILTSLDFNAFIQFHAQHGFDATLAVAQHRVRIPYGVVRHGADGVFLGIDEKPMIAHYVAAGIYLLSPQFRALVKQGERIDMPALLERGQREGLQAGLFPIHEYWTDVGRPEDLAQAKVSLAGAGAGKTSS